MGRLLARRAFVLGLLPLLAACGTAHLRVDPASPKPNVDLTAAICPSKLDLDTSVLDQFVIPPSDSINQVPVTGWRSTLTRGFESGFKGGTGGLVLQLRQADLTFAPAALRGGMTSAARARVRFKASIVDASGKELVRITGDADAHDAATRPQPEAMTANAAQAVEAMYEGIAAKVAEAANASAGR